MNASWQSFFAWSWQERAWAMELGPGVPWPLQEVPPPGNCGVAPPPLSGPPRPPEHTLYKVIISAAKTGLSS